MISFRYRHNTDIRFGKGMLKQAPGFIKKMGFVKLDIIIDQALIRNKLVCDFLERLSDEGFNTELFVPLKGEPSYDLIDMMEKRFIRSPDCLIGIGGGSVMDLTKGLAVLITNSGPAVKYKGFPELVNKPVPVILIPSLPGSGSEVAYNAVFTDKKAKMRFGINTELNYPVLTIVEPDLALSAPKEAIISSTMDCVCHAVSSYISPNASPITRALAKEAFQQLRKGIPTMNYERLFLAGMLANMSLNNAGSGLEGSFSYPLGALFGVPHGIGEGIFLPYLIRLYWERGDKSLMIELCKDTPLPRVIEELYEQLGAPKTLNKWLTRKNIPAIVKQVKPSFKECPIKFTETDCKKMLEKHINGR